MAKVISGIDPESKYFFDMMSKKDKNLKADLKKKTSEKKATPKKKVVKKK